MTTRPDKKPRWATVPTVNPTSGKNNVIEPSDGKKDLGWDYLEKPARNFLNWVMNKAYEWIDYFDKNTQLLVRENEPTPDLSFILQGGTYFTNPSTLVTVVETTLGPVVAPTVNPRIDRVILNRITGVLSITTGVENASPVPIALNVNEIPLAQIALVVSQTEILNADITDERPLWDLVLASTATRLGIIEIATNTEAQAKSDGSRALTPANLAALDSSLTFKGMIEKSTDAEAIAKSDTDRALTPSNLAALDSSETVKGLSEIATQTEVNAGTDNIRYLTPLKLANLAGSLLQTVFLQDGAVATGTTVIPRDDTIPQNTEGDQYMSLAITPANVSNRLKIEVIIYLANSVAESTDIIAALFKDSVANALAAGIMGITDTSSAAERLENGFIVFTHWMTAGTTSAITFKVRAGSSSAGTTTFNGDASIRLFGGVMSSSITITEYKV